jgi:hypothetical protein
MEIVVEKFHNTDIHENLYTLRVNIDFLKLAFISYSREMADSNQTIISSH